MLEEFISIYKEYDIPLDFLNDYLIEAAYDGSFELVIFLLEETEVKKNHDDNMPLIHAANKNNIEILNELLKYKEVNPTAKKSSAIYFAFKNNNEEAIEILWKIPEVRESASKDRPKIHNILKIKFLKNNIEGF